MPSPAFKIPRPLNTILWGNSVAMSWMWGLGLFFSVQFSIQFGLVGLLAFAIPNALGLFFFGLVTQHLAKRRDHPDSLEDFFSAWSRPFRLVFFLYQFLAITLTIFALIRYVWQPLNLSPELLYLPLTMFVALMVAILLGEEFDIRRIKWSHAVFFALAAFAILIVLQAPRLIGQDVSTTPVPAQPIGELRFWGFVIPILVGFLLGPWLDLQQWQRAIQINREKVSIRAAYASGSLQFFLLLLFHGLIALWAIGQIPSILGLTADDFLRPGLAPYLYGHDSTMRLFFGVSDQHPSIFGAYCVFLASCLFTTLDSGYIALRWFFQGAVNRSKNALLAFVPKGLITSPIPVFSIAALIALGGAFLGVEIEYFMLFYGTFFVGYSALGVALCYLPPPSNPISQIKMFCIGSIAVVIFAYGYFLANPAFMIIGSLLPLGYVPWLLFKSSPDTVDLNSDDVVTDSPTETSRKSLTANAVKGAVDRIEGAVHAAAAAFHDVGGHFEGKRFVYSFIATYADTNSVGNVYFAMYPLWVGKARELFFNQVMPGFDLDKTPFYILTRSFEHKFVRETREFETITVKIWIGEYNRKFVTLEHAIYDSDTNLLGKGKQSLLFVRSSDYKMIDLPPEVATAFIQHA